METLIPYRFGSHWGYSNRRKEIIIECVFDEVQETGLDGEVLLVKSNGINLLANRKGKIIASGFHRFITCENNGSLVIIIGKVLYSRQVCKGSDDYENFPKEAGAYYPDNLAITDYEFSACDKEGNFGETVVGKSFEEVKQLLACSEINAIQPAKSIFQERLHPQNIPYPGTSSGFKGFFLNADNIRDSRFEYEYVLDFCEGIAPVQTAKDQWIYINENNQQISKQSYIRAFPFQKEGIAKVVTSLENCKNIDAGNQNNWTTIPDNLWVPEGATFGYIDREGTEYWSE